MKKIISLLLSLFVICGVVFGLSACSNNTESHKISVVTTVFPLYDWAKQVIGENNETVELTLLFNNGADPHSYQPTAEDFAKISTCDLLIFIGGDSDDWIEKAISTSQNKNMKIINAFDVLGEAVIKDDHGIDEHIWLSVKNAQTVCTNIAEELSSIDSENANVYTQNASSYNKKLSDLDEDYKNTVANAQYNTLIFADRFPFHYLLEDYGISHYAAFDGCSAESEASVETITLLAQKLKALDLPAVLTIDGSDKSIAKTVLKTAETDREILTLDSMQTVTDDELENGINYLAVMQSNLEILKKALKG